MDPDAGGIQHYFQNQTSEIWITGNDCVIKMLPKPGYGGTDFKVTCNVNVHFEDDIVEFAKWNCWVDDYPGPYPNKCN